MIGRHAAEQGSVPVGIDDAFDHIHPDLILCLARGEAGAGEHRIQVTADGCRLDDPEAIVVKHRHLCEWMPLHVLRGLRTAGKNIDLNLIEVGELLFVEHHLHGSHIGGPVEGPELELSHPADLLLELPWPYSTGADLS